MAYTQFQFRRDTITNWVSNNPILAEGEIGVETDGNRFKIGDGVTAWNSLVYPAYGIETDPVFSASASSSITTQNLTNWNTAYSWGDHAAAGYPDDYEEGTWTPVFSGFNGSESGQSYSSQIGWYTKIGNLVTFGCFITVSTVGTITGEYLVIKGLPFTVGNNAYGGVLVSYYSGLNTNVYSMTSWPGSNLTELFLGKSTGAVDTTVLSTPSDIKNGSTMYLGGSYRV